MVWTTLNKDVKVSELNCGYVLALTLAICRDLIVHFVKKKTSLWSEALDKSFEITGMRGHEYCD